MSDSDLNLLVALDALLAEGSVAGAARRLGLSDSAMSRTLARLRAATGDPLLVRAGRGMVATPHAQAIRERTRAALHETLAVLRPAGADLDLATLRQTLTIRANEGFVEAFGAQLIAAVTADAPHVFLRFAAKPAKSAAPLREGTVDLEIGVLGEMGPEVRIQALFRDRFVGAVRRGHPLERARRVSARRYVAFGHVVAARKDDPRGPVDTALAALGLERTIAAAVPGFPAALAVARHSDLIALVPASFFDAQAGDSAHAFALPVDAGEITVSQMWHPRLDADPVHRWLRQRVLAVCRGPAAD
ncbi:LysR family transcriptional regulator [Burkholderia sp. Ac-20379]|uniref:LysR family transcriptional regulator n=1 Tax=Burkholderia sp. Ac-20379 TaxID=2703900 RepID=UPI0019804F98|nr:LysR family transcriptional regulator [Burkholderia sp. Ac-20379]MBN3725086.1 LysR family transcriptional regulator [Burkholderia sp. Ac-20379]